MLRVKDNVTHQKLNALGFYKNDFDLTYDKETDYDCIISMNIDNRLLTTLVWDCAGEYTELAKDDFTTIEELKCLAPKMIDLVEEVE